MTFLPAPVPFSLARSALVVTLHLCLTSYMCVSLIPRLFPRVNECWAGPGNVCMAIALFPGCVREEVFSFSLSPPGGKTALVSLPLTCAALAGPDGLSEDTLREAILTLETKVPLRVLVPDVSGRVIL